MEKLFFIYKTVNTINNKFYIGKHETFNKKDNYLGSGKLLKRAIKKYGEANFNRKILFFCKDRIELIEKEKEIINTDLLNSKNCYNICSGGTGGPTMLGRKMSKKHRANISKANKGKARPKTSEIMKTRVKKEGKNFFLVKYASHPKSKNGMAKRFIFTDPQSKDYIVVGEFDAFCKLHNLSRHYARKFINKGKVSFDKRRCNAEIKCFNLLGWEVTSTVA